MALCTFEVTPAVTTNYPNTAQLITLTNDGGDFPVPPEYDATNGIVIAASEPNEFGNRTLTAAFTHLTNTKFYITQAGFDLVGGALPNTVVLPAGFTVDLADLLQQATAQGAGLVSVYVTDFASNQYFGTLVPLNVTSEAVTPFDLAPQLLDTSLPYAFYVFSADNTLYNYNIALTTPASTIATRTFDISTTATPTGLGGLEETSALFIGVGEVLAAPFTVVQQVPAGTVIVDDNFGSTSYVVGDGVWVLAYLDASDGTFYALSDITGFPESGFVPWGGGNITLGDGDGIGFVLFASSGDNTSTVSEQLVARFPYGSATLLCDNAPDDGGTPPRQRSATISTRFAQFYMSYKFIPAGTDVLPPQVSEIIPLGE